MSQATIVRIGVVTALARFVLHLHVYTLLHLVTWQFSAAWKNDRMSATQCFRRLIGLAPASMVNAANARGRTPLHLAAGTGNLVGQNILPA